MFTYSRKHQVRLTGWAIAAALLPATLLLAMAEESFTQKPVVAPSQIRDKPSVSTSPNANPATSGRDRGPMPSWIWGKDNQRRYFLRKEFPGGATAARLLASCDDRMTIYINGKEVLRNNSWRDAVDVDVHKFLKPGNNVLLAEVENESGPAGFIAKLILTLPKNEIRYVISDDTWQAAEKKDADHWPDARAIAKLGADPWGNVFEAAAGSVNPPRDVFQVLPGFQVEHLFTVPRDQLGSWVCITFDRKGRLIASDQGMKGLCLITPPPIGSKEPTRVEHLDVKISAAQGMLPAFGGLYVSLNGGMGSGLYRVRNGKGEKVGNEVMKLKPLQGDGEHGPHGLLSSPDGKSIFIVCGNHTDLLENFDVSRIRSNWSEDLLLPRLWDANGHARGRLAPGGWVARTDPEGKTWEMFSIGYRNAYRMAFNADGEMFVYDSDMEWDFGTPWYRPTRVLHATSGSDFGWRSGTGKWPAYYVDSLPPLLDIGPGSPVGMTFGYGTKFPAKYQKALFICDWTFGTVYALHLDPDGSTYKAHKEEFLSRTPLPLTDIAVGPDGALYFAIGGRGIQSELFRVTYVGQESTAAINYHDPRGSELRVLRHNLERYHGSSGNSAKAVSFIYPHLGYPDRFIRYAARVALEFQNPVLWQDRVLAERNVERLIQGAVALARQGDKALQPPLLAALDRLDFGKLSESQQLDLLRVHALVFIRMGEPEAKTAARLAKKFDAFYPAKTDSLNRELSSLLVYLKSPTVISKSIALMRQEAKKPTADSGQDLLARNRDYGGTIARVQANSPDVQKLHYLFVLRNLRDGWTLEERKFYFQWLNEVRQRSGGASYQGFLNNIDKDAYDNATDVERLAIEAAGLRKPFRIRELPKPKGPGRDWKLLELVQFAEPKLKGRDFRNGRKMFAAARCVVCHSFNGDGGATGPDLTQLAGRFNLKDVSEAILEPSKVVSDQYRATTVTTHKGKVYTGRIVSETKENITILLDPEDSTKAIEIKRSAVESMKPSLVSVMPEGLLKLLNENEVLDLLAYLLSRGDPKHAMFRP